MPGVQDPCLEGLRLLDPKAGRDPGPSGVCCRPQSGLRSLLISGLGASGGEVLGQRVEASDPQRIDSRDPEAGLSRAPTSVVSVRRPGGM